jgi:excisionase family DNA binding protein
MPAKNQKRRRTHLMPTRTSEVLDVRMAAQLLTVSLDTVYDLFKSGELPGRKVNGGCFGCSPTIYRKLFLLLQHHKSV